MAQSKPPEEPPLDPIEALTLIRTLIENVDYYIGENAVEGTLREVRSILDRASPKRRRSVKKP